MTDLAAGDAWIIDGNYSRTVDVRARVADTALLLDYSPAGCLARALRRSLGNYGRAVQAPGCPEKIDLEFLRWIATYRRRSRQRVLAQLREGGPDLDLKVFSAAPRRRAVPHERWLAAFNAARGASPTSGARR